jgi:hypothetical protein
MKLTNTKKYLPILIGGLVSIPLAIGAFFLTQGAMARANTAKPVNVKVTNISDSKAIITWTTDQESQGVVEYGSTPDKINIYAPEISEKTVHKVELTLLTPNTPYYYRIRIGEEVYDNEGIAWTFRTKGEGGIEPTSSAQDDPDALPTVEVLINPILRLPTATASIMLYEPTKPPTCPNTTDCELIKAKLGKECSSAEYVACLKKTGAVQGANTGSLDSSGSKVSPTKKSSKPRTTITIKPTLALPQTAGGE